MISSDVMPVGGVFSSGPSCAAAGEENTAQAAMIVRKTKLRTGLFIQLFYRIIRNRCFLPGADIAPLRHISTKTHNRGDPPPTPLRSVRPRVGARSFCRLLGCHFVQGVVARKNSL